MKPTEQDRIDQASRLLSRMWHDGALTVEGDLPPAGRGPDGRFRTNPKLSQRGLAKVRELLPAWAWNKWMMGELQLIDTTNRP
jgi:hypothetical protein